MLCGLYSFIFAWAFFFTDIVIFYKFEGIRPIKKDISTALLDFGFYVIIFPHIVLLFAVGQVLSYHYYTAFPVSVTMLVCVSIVAILSARQKNRPEEFIILSKKVKNITVIANAVILGSISMTFLKFLCRTLCFSDILKAVIPLIIYVALSTRYLKTYKEYQKWMCG
ncbi:MAG: hypothetical protein H0Z18_06795 [Thermococcus sp.]|uniref:hypothetical protein n=1 Tax=Thermococcus sp. TaxID=35749 RepID=UPI001D792029|nr:hypothetical protein [Thermococcus sp.]MBO8174948.1 hypothetical protein [Thermococcus sp.]